MDKRQKQAKRRQEKKVRRAKRLKNPDRPKVDKAAQIVGGFEAWERLMANTKED